MNKKLGIVVPVYNEEEYLECCIESIICQTYTDWELVLVNDASSDKSGDICEKFAKLDQRIKVIHFNENRGPIKSRFEGVKFLDTEYITFVDADDWLEHMIYQQMMDMMLKCDVDMVSTRGIIRFYSDIDNRIDNDAIKAGLYYKNEIKKNIIPIMLWEDKLKVGVGMNPSLCTKIFKRSLLIKQYEGLKRYNFHYGEDVAICYPYILEAERIYVLDICGYYHRQRGKKEIPHYIKDEFFYENLFDLYKYLRGCFLNYNESRILMEQLDLFYIYAVNQRKRLYLQDHTEIRHLFPFHCVEKGCSIVLYGAGVVGESYYKQLQRLSYCEEILWVDKAYEKYQMKNICSPEEIFRKEYDYIVIAILSERINQQVEEFLLGKGVKKEKIVRYQV